MPKVAKTADGGVEALSENTKHKTSMDAIYAKHNKMQAEAGVNVENMDEVGALAHAYRQGEFENTPDGTGAEGEKAAAMEQLGGEDGSDADSGVSLSDVRDRDDFLEGETPENRPEPGEQFPAEQQTAPDIDPMALLEGNGFFIADDGEMYARINVYGEERVVPASEAVRGYQTAEASQKKFMDAAMIARNNERTPTKQESVSAQQESGATLDEVEGQIVDMESEIDEMVLEGVPDTQIREKRLELRKLNRQYDDIESGRVANPQITGVESPSEGETHSLPVMSDSERVSLNDTFRASFSQHVGIPRFMDEAREAMSFIPRLRAKHGATALTPTELAMEAGNLALRILKDSGELGRFNRTQHRRQTETPPRPASVSRTRVAPKPTSGATVTEEEMEKGRREYLAAGSKKWQQFKAQRSIQPR